MVLTFAGPVVAGDTAYSTMRDRQEQQEYFVSEWQALLQEKIFKHVEANYPSMAVHVFGKSFIYR